MRFPEDSGAVETQSPQITRKFTKRDFQLLAEKRLSYDLRWQTVNMGQNITSSRHVSGSYNTEVDYLNGSQMMRQKRCRVILQYKSVSLKPTDGLEWSRRLNIEYMKAVSTAEFVMAQ